MSLRDRPEHGICEIFHRDHVVGLGFAISRFHVVSCAHVVNSALGRADKRDRARPGEGEVLRLRFAIGTTPGDDDYRTASVTGWLPAEAGTFDGNDIGVLELAEPAPTHVQVLRPVGYRPLMPVQMWGPQPGRPDGGHVKGELLGEVRGGRIQISVSGGPFRVRPGFSGGPVWEPGSGDVVGVLAACGAEDFAADAYLLGTDRITAAWPGWPTAGRAGRTESTAERDLLDEVADAARHHPDFADAEISRHGDRLVATIKIRAGGQVLGTVRQRIEVCYGEVTADVVAGFAETVRAYRQAGNGNAVGTLVYTGPPTQPELRDRAAQSGVDLRSLAEFQTGVDLRPFAGRQHHELATDPRYPRAGYVPQRYTSPPSSEIADTPLIEHMLSWLAEPEGHLVVVLAPFGHGKTYLLHELACRMHDVPDYPAIPVLVRLRDLEKDHHIDDLLAAQLRRGGERRIDMDRLEYLRREGRIVLLFDGFDELARRVSYDEAVAHMAAIIQAAEGRAKVVVTSRREHFLTDADVPASLGRQLLTQAGRRVVQITQFDPGQIRTFLTTRLSGNSADRFMALLESSCLIELAANPRMLAQLTEIGEDALAQVGRSGSETTLAAVFERVLEDWLTGEYERLHPHGTEPGPWVAALRTAAASLAAELWTSGASSLTLADLQAQVGALAEVPGSGRLNQDQAVHVLGSGSILVRTGDGQFHFMHRSLMEWLTADAIAAQLGQHGDYDTLARLTARPLTSLQLDLLTELASPDAISGWVRETINGSDHQVRLNALAVAERIGITEAESPPAGGQDLADTLLAQSEGTAAVHSSATAADIFTSLGFPGEVATHEDSGGEDLPGDQTAWQAPNAGLRGKASPTGPATAYESYRSEPLLPRFNAQPLLPTPITPRASRPVPGLVSSGTRRQRPGRSHNAMRDYARAAPRRRWLRWIVPLMLVTAAAVVTTMILVGGNTKKYPVPDVDGLTRTLAVSRIAADGLVPHVTYQYSSSFVKGLVISTNPVGGEKIGKGGTVTVYVSNGSAPWYYKSPTQWLGFIVGIVLFMTVSFGFVFFYARMAR